MSDVPIHGLCGCGKPVRYIVPGDPQQGACNKYKRCQTYDELKVVATALQVRVDTTYDYLQDLLNCWSWKKGEAAGNDKEYKDLLAFIEDLKPFIPGR